MKKISLILSLLAIALSAAAANHGSRHKTDSIFNSVRQLYTQGKISTDSVVSLALYHKGWSPQVAEKCLKLVADNSLRSKMELGVLYAFSPEFNKKKSDGVKILQEVAKSGYNDANAYLGLYYFQHRDYKKAKSCFDALKTMKYGFDHTALANMYLNGDGVPEDYVKARENYRQAALMGYPRGMTLYGFNLRTKTGGQISYPDSFFWLYIAGDLGEDAARTALFLPRRNQTPANTETAQKAQEALQWIEQVHTGKKIQNEPIYKDGFLPSLKDREKAAEEGNDWARFYLGSMNYNGDFLNQNYTQAIKYYEPIAKNGKLPHSVLAVVNERLAEMYREGKGTKANPAKAAQHTRIAAHYGNLPAYKILEGIPE